MSRSPVAGSNGQDSSETGGPASVIAVTGAAGFIGRGLLPVLTGAGRSVRAVDRVAVPGEAGRIEPLVLDLAPGADLAPVVSGVDAVVHLAARAHVTRERAADPLALFRTVNRDATLRLAEAAASAGVRRFVFLSSIGVLGERTMEVPFSADSAPAPVADYARSKWEAEEGLRSLAARTAMEVVIVRPTLVHGPGAPGNFRRLLRLVASGVPLPLAGVRGDRTFVGRANLCDLLLTALTHPAAPRAPLLAGDPETMTLPELLRFLAEGMGRPLRLFPLPGLAMTGGLPVVGGPIRKLTDALVVDTAETSARLGWTARESARAGVLTMARAWAERPW